MSFIGSVYEASASVTIRHHIIDNSLVEFLIKSTQNLRTAIREDRHDTDLSRFMTLLNRFQYGITAAPIASHHPSIIDAQSLHDLSRLQWQIAFSYSAYAELSRQALDACLSVHRADISPLLGCLSQEQLFPREHRSALLVRDRRFVDATCDAIQEIEWLAEADVKTPGELRKLRPLDDLVIIGPRHRFPPHVITAPRANTLHFIRYSYICDAWRDEHAFTAPIVVPQRRTTHEAINRSEIDSDWMPEADAVETIQWLASATDVDEWDMVDAQIALLADEHFVFLESGPGSSTMQIIDPDNDRSPITRLEARELQSGMFLLLRTDGGGDFIVPIADQLLGQRAEPLRRKQRYWKDLLRARVRRSDLFTVAVQLLDRGSTRADEQNVRNWMSYRSISTQDREDFDAILSLVGLESETDDYWQSMRQIRRAHQKAGNRIRNLLLEEVHNADFDALETTGRMEFHLENMDGGSLTAFRIEKVLPETVRVPLHRIGRAYKSHDITLNESIKD